MQWHLSRLERLKCPTDWDFWSRANCSRRRFAVSCSSRDRWREKKECIAWRRTEIIKEARLWDVLGSRRRRNEVHANGSDMQVRTGRSNFSEAFVHCDKGKTCLLPNWYSLSRRMTQASAFSVRGRPPPASLREPWNGRSMGMRSGHTRRKSIDGSIKNIESNKSVQTVIVMKVVAMSRSN